MDRTFKGTPDLKEPKKEKLWVFVFGFLFVCLFACCFLVVLASSSTLWHHATAATAVAILH